MISFDTTHTRFPQHIIPYKITRFSQPIVPYKIHTKTNLEVAGKVKIFSAPPGSSVVVVIQVSVRRFWLDRVAMIALIRDHAHHPDVANLCPHVLVDFRRLRNQ